VSAWLSVSLLSRRRREIIRIGDFENLYMAVGEVIPEEDGVTVINVAG
jgi:hypothetical protein